MVRITTFIYQLPHFYDKLRPIIATSGGQSFRRRQQQSNW